MNSDKPRRGRCVPLLLPLSISHSYFPFSIIKMPYLSSNIPYNIFYNTILSEILRIARCSLLYADFLHRARELCCRMKNQGADVILGTSSLLRFIEKHSSTFKKMIVSFRSIAEACYN